MPDYGHEILFGAGLDSPASGAASVVELAELADRGGVDLVAFMDHPYQPAYLETWTLLSFVAARTSRIRIASSVHPAPMRPPAVLARSAATLDLLSRGRFELGLGAGHYFDAMAAMGARRYAAGEAVDALEEAIQVLRSLWDVDARRPVRVEGRHHRVIGAKRGPRPAHDIGIWLGAYRPRMLRLTARVADGWWPSLPAMRPGDLAAGNAVIDEAAAEAGRSPGDIRRLLNPGVELPVEQLAELALEHGVSVFTIEIDGAQAIHRVTEEIAPAVRELVAKERATSMIDQAEPRDDNTGEPPA